MSITLKSGKILRNLEEQVQYLTDYHAVNQGLVQWGIRVVGQVETEEELPLPYDGEYGDAIAVGTEAPFFFYIWTRASIEGDPAYWFPFGEISIVGPKGPQGEKGDKGNDGNSTRWYADIGIPVADSTKYKTGDMYLQSNGQTYIYNSEEYVWSPISNIKGPQGIQGLQGLQGIQGEPGPQGPKGETGDVGGFINIVGQLDNINQLPSPSTLNNLTYAYLVNHEGGTDQDNDHYDLYIQVGENSATAIWLNAGPFNAATLVTVGGVGQNVWEADTKLDKVINLEGELSDLIYVAKGDGTQTMKRASFKGEAGALVSYVYPTVASPNYIPGTFFIADPQKPQQPATKNYVDNNFIQQNKTDTNIIYGTGTTAGTQVTYKVDSTGTGAKATDTIVQRTSENTIRASGIPRFGNDLINKDYFDENAPKMYPCVITLTCNVPEQYGFEAVKQLVYSNTPVDQILSSSEEIRMIFGETSMLIPAIVLTSSDYETTGLHLAIYNGANKYIITGTPASDPVQIIDINELLMSGFGSLTVTSIF